MPEGHTIHGLARTHRKLFAGTTIAAWSPQGRFAEEAAQLDGQILEATEARGKHLFYRFDAGDILHIHLGLIGMFRTYTDDAPAPTPGTRLALENDVASAYLAGPMTCALVDGAERVRVLESLGPDPLHNRTGLASIVEGLGRRTIPIAAALLDQSVISGLGNIYRSELLFLCGIDPRRPAKSLGGDEVKCIWEWARAQLRIGIAAGRIVTVDPTEVGADNRGRLGDEDRLYVYHRDDLPCRRCGTTIRKVQIGGRFVWFCPYDQN